MQAMRKLPADDKQVGGQPSGIMSSILWLTYLLSRFDEVRIKTKSNTCDLMYQKPLSEVYRKSIEIECNQFLPAMDTKHTKKNITVANVCNMCHHWSLWVYMRKRNITSLHTGTLIYDTFDLEMR